jgi:hypothetical protein
MLSLFHLHHDGLQPILDHGSLLVYLIHSLIQIKPASLQLSIRHFLQGIWHHVA